MNGRSRRTVIIGIVAAVSLRATDVCAHPMPGVGDFYAGMLHPVTALDSLLPLAAIGLLAGLQSQRIALRMLLCGVCSVAVGAGVAAFGVTSIEMGLLAKASMVALGGLVAFSPSLRVPFAISLAVLPGVVVGMANGAEMGDQVSPFRFLPGVLLACGMVMIYGIGAVRGCRQPWMRIGIRVLGSWIAALGVMVLALG